MGVSEVLVAICLLSGSALSLVAAIGMLRFPDVLSQLHLSTKPQVLGVLLILLGVGIRLGVGLDLGMVILAALFQLATQPVAAHMVARAALRSGGVQRSDLVVDELEPGTDEPGGRTGAGTAGGGAGAETAGGNTDEPGGRTGAETAGDG